MAVVLTPCMRAFLMALTTPLRAMFRQLLYTLKMMMEAELSKLAAIVGRNDVVAQMYKAAMDKAEDFLSPIESVLNQLPLDSLKGCGEGNALLGNGLNIYYDKKAQLQDLAYKYAQYGFASNYVAAARENYQKVLDKIDDVITYIDELAMAQVETGGTARVARTGQAGEVLDKNLSTMEVTLGNGIGTVKAGETYKINP